MHINPQRSRIVTALKSFKPHQQTENKIRRGVISGDNSGIVEIGNSKLRNSRGDPQLRAPTAVIICCSTASILQGEHIILMGSILRQMSLTNAGLCSSFLYVRAYNIGGKCKNPEQKVPIPQQCRLPISKVQVYSAEIVKFPSRLSLMTYP